MHVNTADNIWVDPALMLVGPTAKDHKLYSKACTTLRQSHWNGTQ